MTSSKKSLLNSILESSLLGIMSFDSVRDDQGQIVDFVWLYSNDRGASLAGQKAKQLIGKRMLQVLPENKESGFFDRYIQVVETGEEQIFERFFDGQSVQKWFRISAVKQNDGFTVTFEDITDLKETMLELENREEKYRKLFQESIDAIFLIDENFKFLETNGALHRLFNYSKEEILNLPLSVLFEHEEEYLKYNQKLKEEEQVEELDVNLVDANGKSGSCLVNTIKTEGDSSQPTTYLGVIRDMTRRKQADKALIQAEKLSMTGKIARTIAHEVRNPLTNLTLALEQLKDEIPEDVEDADLYFNIIQRNSDRIGKLISDLLNSSKPKALNLERKLIAEVLEESLSLVTDRLNLQQMSLERDFKSVSIVQIDQDQFQVAFLNIFINAIEAMKPEIGVLAVSTFDDSKNVFVEIQDNGQGISEENLSKLFEPFFSGKKEGTGLGLVTVQNIIHSHKGNIRAESTVGLGTKFIVSFPIAQ